MRLIYVEFNGFKRLLRASANMDGRIIALLGPNEAGKTSVLEALNWLTWGEGPLPAHHVSRALEEQSSEDVVVARFRLEKDDLSRISDLAVVSPPRELRLSRNRRGRVHKSVYPPLRRIPDPFLEAAQALKGYETWYLTHFDPDHSDDVTAGIAVALELMNDPDERWSGDEREEVGHVHERLVDAAGDASAAPIDREMAERAAVTLETVMQIAQQPHPQAAAADKLWAVSPDFVLFGEEDRALRTEYDLSDEGVRKSPPRGLTNLLHLADTTLEELWQVRAMNVPARLATLLKRANSRLRARMRDAWRQSPVTIELGINGDHLTLMVDELSEEGARTPLGERSAGLQTFIALVSFLAIRSSNVPPIVLIDEAETHLHYDAQIDLVNLLTHELRAAQVIFSTHSPGCLPMDMGTGVRFVVPDPNVRDASLIRADFWSANRPGFSPLLYAMGAGGAAFSVARHTLLGEGPSDMILLPSLIRAANRLDYLRYQVAPGLAVCRADDPDLQDAGARVVYVIDGDSGGDSHERHLLASGVPATHILKFSEGIATEDLLDRSFYLGVLNNLLRESGGEYLIQECDLDSNKTVSRAVEDWGKAHGVRVPSKVVVASRIAQGDEGIELSERGIEDLRNLHQAAMRLFGIPGLV